MSFVSGPYTDSFRTGAPHAGRMEKGDPGTGTDAYDERATLCLPDFANDSVLHRGSHGFDAVLRRYFGSAENNATERLITLKSKLRRAATYDFWSILMEDLCDIVGAQCGMVAKRILVDDENAAVEMPPLGEPGSCLLGVAFYLNGGGAVRDMRRDYRYHAYGSPCAHMRHDKVFIIPERLSDFVPDSPNPLPWKKSEAFIGVPLFSEGKCFAHLACIWSSEGAAKRKLSWNYIEMFLHSLEDLISERILGGRGFAKPPADPQSATARVIPLDAITASQSLRPYARSLSHELRTPMQGVVGMLDVMHATVVDAIATQKNQLAKSVFEELRSNIEMVQDSSRRAVEAADNIVHAYDLNMEMPESHLGTDDNGDGVDTPCGEDPRRPSIVIECDEQPFSTSPKKRSRQSGPDYHPGPPLKRLAAMTAKGELQRKYLNSSLHADSLATGFVELPPRQFAASDLPREETPTGSDSRRSSAGSAAFAPASSMGATPHPIVIRQFMHRLVDEAICGSHPVQRANTENELGEVVRVRLEGSRGQVQDLTINLVIESDIPEVIVTEEVHLQFAIQKVVENAIKFTESGTIIIIVKLARSAQLVEIRVIDTGCGITEESKAHLFKPHFQEDASSSRLRDGLGLSLFNAKARVRKNLRGDMTLERSATHGPSKGSEFLIRLPLSEPSDRMSETPLTVSPIVIPHSRESRAGSPLSTVPSITKLPASALTLAPMSRSPSPAPGSKPISSKASKKKNFNPNLAKEIPLTILVAEDNVINRQILVGYLKKLGYHDDDIILAFDGVEAVQQYRASLSNGPVKRINAVLMDLWMPNMDGYEAAERILKIASEGEERLAIMAVTADITSHSRERARQAGMVGFISKPYTILDIELLIQEHFQREVLHG